MSVIATLTAPFPVVLAPMSGLSSYPFRKLNRRFGCTLAFIEMINVRALYYSTPRTQEMLVTDSTDRPLGIQILGKDPYYILKAIEKLNRYKFDILDFNAACSQKKITSKGEGASLLRDPKKLQALLQLIVQHCPVPVTVKMRLGWDTAVSSRDIALYAQDAGVKAIFVHGRTKLQGFSASVDYESIRKIKQAVNIEVIGSGDIFSPFLAKKMVDETGCDGVLVARGALGNPWIFKEIESFIKSGKMLPRPMIGEIVDIMKEHFKLFLDFFGEKRGVAKFCKFYIWYTRGLLQVKQLRSKAQGITTREDMFAIINELVN